MTFDDLAEIVRDRYLAEKDSTVFGNAEVLPIALDATNEVAFRLGLPRKVQTLSAAADTGLVTLPADVLGGNVFEVLVDDRSLERVASLGALRTFSGFGTDPEAYWMDPRIPTTLRVGPAPEAATNVEVVHLSRFYLDGLTYRAPTGDSDVWGTTWTGTAWSDSQYPHLKDLHVLATVVACWRHGLQIERAEYYRMQLEVRLREVAPHLGTFLPPLPEGGSQ